MDSVLEDVLVELLVDRPFRSVKEMNRHLLPRRTPTPRSPR